MKSKLLQIALISAFLSFGLSAKEIKEPSNTQKVVKKTKKGHVKFESPFNKRYYKSPKYDKKGKLIKEKK